jgi:Tfp pilus assembly protein FimV
MASRKFGRSLLAQHIDAVLEGRRASCSALLPPVDSSRGKTAVSKPILCAGLAFLVLDPGIASAVSLGELSIDSDLNQPLSASVPVRISGGELLTADCVTIPEHSGAELSNLNNPELKIPTTERPGTYSIRITTRQPLFEPMYEFAIRVNCLGTPVLLRHYVLMLDLPGLPAPLSRQTMRESSDTVGPDVSGSTVQTQQPKFTSAPANRTNSTRAAAPANRMDSARAAAPDTMRSQVTARLIETGADYRVSGGDTLSSIAERVKGRPSGSVWDVADWIYAANPSAFVNADPNVIKLGSMIRIPAPGYWETGPIAATVRESTITADPGAQAAPLQTLTNAIEPGTNYLVSSGDCLSNIAERVAGRPSGSVWDVADWIFGANRNAFVDANPDLIRLGSVIRIPAPGYWETDASPVPDRESAEASTAVHAGVRPETPVDETDLVEMPAPTSAEAIKAREIDYGVSESSPPDADQSLADLAATPVPQPTQRTEFIDDFALDTEMSPGNEETIFAEQGNKSAFAAGTDTAGEITAFDSTADEIAALRRQLAEARELAEAARQTALRNQAIAATQSTPISSPEGSDRGISPLLAIPLGLLVGGQRPWHQPAARHSLRAVGWPRAEQPAAPQLADGILWTAAPGFNRRQGGHVAAAGDSIAVR